MQNIITEQNKVVLQRFLHLQNQSYSGTDSIDEEAENIGNLAPTSMNVLQIPTISKKNSNKIS